MKDQKGTRCAKKVAYSLLFVLSFFAKSAFAAIQLGDIAVIGLNTDPASTTKIFAVVTLGSIPSGEIIFFTDKGISGGVFQADLPNEGIFRLTTSSVIPAGTVIQFSVTAGSTPTVSSSPSVGTLTVTNGWTSTTVSESPFGNNGDQILVFQGSVASPTFIFGFHSGTTTQGLTNGWNTGGSSSDNYSELPPGLTNGTTAISHAGASAADNYVYSGTLSGRKESLLSNICDSFVWSSRDSSPFDLAPGGSHFPGTNPLFLVNHSPTDISLSATSINENVAANSIVGVLSSTDPDAGNTVFTYTLVSGTGSTDNASFNISGSNLRISASPNYEAKSSYSIRIRTADQHGASYQEVFIITINNVNEPPTDITLSASSINENVVANATVGTLSTSDPDASTSFTYSLVGGTGSTDNASFNIDDNNLRISASPDYEVKNSYSVRIRTADQGGLTYEKVFTININNVNEPPTDIALSASSINENVVANATVGTLSSSDPDASTSFTYSLVAGAGSTDNAAFNIDGTSLRISASPDYEVKNSYSVRIRTADQGGLTYEKVFTININNVNEPPTDIALSASSVNENVVANTTVGTLSSSDPDDADTFTYSLVAGSGDTDNTSFNIDGNNLRIGFSPDFETKNSYTVRIRSTDQEGEFYEEAFTISIINVNEQPININLTATSIDENEPANSVIGTFSTLDPDAANTFIYSLVAGSGDTDNASFNISGNNLRISFSPDFETKNSYTVRIRSTDQGDESTEKSFMITINNLNEPPADINITATSIDENKPANSVIGTFSALDPDAANSFTYALVAGSGDTDNASFNIDGSDLRISFSPDFETKNSYTVRIRAIDQGYEFYEKAFTISILNVNEQPTDINLTATSIDENEPANSVIGTLSTLDPDAANSFTYSLVAGSGDTDNASFNIDGSTLRISVSTDHETKDSYSILIRTADQDGLTYDKIFTININDVNELPTDISLSSTTVDDQSPANTIVGTFSSADPDAGNTFTYSFVSGSGDADNASFNIIGNDLRISVSPDFFVQNSYSIRIRSTDPGGLYYEETFLVTVIELNVAPTGISLMPSAVSENVPANSIVGTLSTSDLNTIDSFVYSLADGAGADDNASFTINGNELSVLVSPDFETKNSYSIRIRTTDQGGLTYEEQFTITITDAVDLATVITNDASDIGAVAATLAGNVTDDGGGVITETGIVYNTSGVPTTADTKVVMISTADSFTGNVNGLTSSTTYYARAYAINAAGTAYGNEISFTTPVGNSAPSDILLSTDNVNENVAANFMVATLGTLDPDAIDSFTYALVAGTGDLDNMSFSITGNSLHINESPDYETKSSYSIRIRSTDSLGLFFEKAVVIEVNDLDEDVLIPNVLFPNGSEQNRTWGISHLNQTGDVSITIFDGNGRVLFTSNNPQQEWNGTHRGRQVPEDIYFYSVILNDGSKYQGSVQVIY